jgi:hypothetical protein
MINRYLYTVRHRNDFSGGVDIDCWLPVPPEPEHLAAATAYAKMNGRELVPAGITKEITDALFAMELRIRFNADFYPKVLLVKVDDAELDRELMETVLAAKKRDGTIGEFLKSSEL